MENALTYWAFISYSHRDTDWGDWLHKKLESYKIPAPLRNADAGIGKRLYPIFRDREELPGSADLGANIGEALSNSKALLVICSPRSAKSMWVNQEIINYQQLSPGKPVIALLVDGQTTDPGAEDYCLTQRMAELVDDNVAKVVDARTAGKNHSLILQLLALLTETSLGDVSQQDAKRRRTRGVLGLAAAAGIAAVSGFVWQQIDDSQTQAQIAQAKAFTVSAQQAWSNQQAGKALQAISAAVAISEANENIEVDSQTRALLNQILAAPLLELEVGRVDRQIVQLKGTGDPNLWLLEDSEGGIHVFDLVTGQLKWSLAPQGIQAYAVNSHRQLIVRADGLMLNLDLASGTQNCQLALDTRTSQPELGRLDWLKQDWFAELTGVDMEAGYFAVQQVQFVNSQDCTITEKRNLGWSVGFGLVAVLDEQNFIVAFDSFNNKEDGSSEPINVIQRWPSDVEQTTETLIVMRGQMAQYVPGSHNNNQYDGPIYKTQPDKAITFMAFRNDQKGIYEIARMDWQAQQVTHKQTLPHFPKQIFWNNAQRDAVMVVNQALNGPSYEHEFMAFENADLAPHGPYPMPGVADLSSISGDFGTLLSNGNSNMRWTNLHTQERHELGAQSISLGQSEWRTNWIDQTTGILAHSDGRITKLVANLSLQLTQLETEGCCSSTLDAQNGLIQGFDASVYQFADNRLSPLVTAASDDTQFRTLSSQYLLQMTPVADVYQEYVYQIWDITEKSLLFELQANDSKVHVGSRWITQQTEEGLILHDFIQGSRKHIDAPEGVVKAELMDDGQTLLLATYVPGYLGGDDLTHFKQVDLASGEVISDVTYALEGVGFMAQIWFDHLRKKAVALTPDGAHYQVLLLDLDKQAINDLGQLSDDFSGFNQKTLVLTDDYLLVNTQSLLSVELFNVFKLSTGQRIDAKDGQRLLATPELLASHRALQIDDVNQTANLLNLSDLSIYPVDCAFMFELEAFAIDTQFLGLQSRQNLCVVDMATGKINKRLVLPQRESSHSVDGFGAYAFDAHNQPAAITYSGMLVSTPPPKPWPEQLARARALLTHTRKAAQEVE